MTSLIRHVWVLHEKRCQWFAKNHTNKKCVTCQPEIGKSENAAHPSGQTNSSQPLATHLRIGILSGKLISYVVSTANSCTKKERALTFTRTHNYHKVVDNISVNYIIEMIYNLHNTKTIHLPKFWKQIISKNIKILNWYISLST